MAQHFYESSPKPHYSLVCALQVPSNFHVFLGTFLTRIIQGRARFIRNLKGNLVYIISFSLLGKGNIYKYVQLKNSLIFIYLGDDFFLINSLSRGLIKHY